MKLSKIFAVAILLPLLGACQSELQKDYTPAEHDIIVKASLPASPASRAQIIYGTQKVDGVDQGEIFEWNEGDCMRLFNITRLADKPLGIEMEALEIDGRNATFQPSDQGEEFEVKAGDIVFAVFGTTERKYKENDATTFDERDIFTTLYVGAESNKPQMIVNNPIPGADGLELIKGNFKMFDIVTAVKDGEVPPLHFKHLSALMRVTLHNETGKDLYLTKLEFVTPGAEEFFNTTLYWSVVTDEDFPETEEADVEYQEIEGHKFKIYLGNEFFKGSEPYTDKIGTTINGKDGTKDIGESILHGDTYELYLSTVPRFNNTLAGEELKISVIENHDTNAPYQITLDGFDVPIQAGKRYWFDLTATPEGTLVLTSDWKPSQE